MGTRGKLVFVWRGRRFAIYNHFDSYPDLMGRRLFEQLVELLGRFGGDARLACEHWGRLVEAVVLTQEETETDHPFHTVHAFEQLEERLRSPLPLGSYGDDEELNVWIEFVWVINLDAARLEMRSYDGTAAWPFVRLHAGRRRLELWIAEAEAKAEREVPPEEKAPFTDAVLEAAAVAMQATARRFLVISRELRPGGALMRLAERRFCRARDALR
jgi:hypothetical protein